jgi:hypothetical protein
MKYFIIFLFFANTCFAHKIVIKNQDGKNIANVSIFLVKETNELIAITDSLGEAEILLEDNGKYLLHLVGYADLSLTGLQIKKEKSVRLDEFVNHLEEVSIGLKKPKTIKISSRQNGYNWGFPNSFKTVIEKVVPIKIEEEGFLNKFTLSLAGNSSHNTRIFRFVLFENINELPGRLFVEERIEGLISGNEMVFDLSKLYLLLKKGNYFIGFETTSSGSFDQREAKEAKKNEGWISGSTKIKSKALKESVSYIRRNLSSWEKDNGNIKGSQMYINMAYELEMDIVN